MWCSHQATVISPMHWLLPSLAPLEHLLVPIHVIFASLCMAHCVRWINHFQSLYAVNYVMFSMCVHMLNVFTCKSQFPICTMSYCTYTMAEFPPLPLNPALYMFCSNGCAYILRMCVIFGIDRSTSTSGQLHAWPVTLYIAAAAQCSV